MECYFKYDHNLGFLERHTTYREDLFTFNCQDRSSDLPRRGSHDAASPIHGHPAATPPLWGVVVHPKVVSEFVGQSDRGPYGVV